MSIQRHLDWSRQRVGQGADVWDPGPLLAAGTRVRDLARGPVVTCPERATIQEAARSMSAGRISSIVVVDEAGRAIGIVTDWDLRERVLAAGRDLHLPVHTIMSSPPVSIAADEPISEAVRLMIERNIHHLVVVAQGRPVGMLAGHDLVFLQGTSALTVARDIEHQRDIAGLRRVQQQTERIIPYLFSRGLRSGQLCRIIAEINDRLVMRVLSFVEAELGPAPLPFCWLVAGSEGRREQTFRTDQDNALVYADPPAAIAESARAYFLEFGQRAVAGLVEVGFPPCLGHYTADNPAWTQPLGGWHEHFRRWAANPQPESVLHSLLFFDFRGIYGDRSLAQQLRDFVTALMPKSNLFLMHLASLSTAQSPPLGFLGHFVLERGGEHKNELDLKNRGTARIVDLARLFALRYRVAETNTLARLELLKAENLLPDDLADELGQAYEFLLDLRIRRQWQQMQAGQLRTNFLNPKQLSPLERSFLREAFQVIGRAQTMLREEYHVARLD